MRTAHFLALLLLTTIPPLAAQTVEGFERYAVRQAGAGNSTLVFTKAAAAAAIQANPCGATVDRLLLKLTRDASGKLVAASVTSEPVTITFSVELAEADCPTCEQDLTELAALRIERWASGPPLVDWSPDDCGCTATHAWRREPETPRCRQARTGKVEPAQDRSAYLGAVGGGG